MSVMFISGSVADVFVCVCQVPTNFISTSSVTLN